MSTEIPDTETAVTLFRQNRRRYNAESTIDRYEIDVRDWLEYLSEPGAKDYDPNELGRDPKDFWDATTADLKRHLTHLLEHSDYAPGSVKYRKSSISIFYEAMAEVSADNAQPYELPNTQNPADDVSLGDWQAFSDSRTKKQRESSSSRKISYLNPDEIADLAAAVPNPTVRNELIVKLLYHTGMRRGELANIQLADIDRERRRILVDDIKNNQQRTAYYPAELDTLLNRWISVHRQSLATADSPYLFPTSHSEQINGEYINQIIKQAAENAGLQASVYTDGNEYERNKVTTHTLRHSFAVSCLKQGMDTRTIQELLGHSKIETTEVYLDIVESDLEDRYRTHGPRSL